MDAQTWDQLSNTYFEEISSPFEEEVVNPLVTFLDAMPEREDLTVADLGCGIGNLLPFLAARFRKVVAVDFSSGMLRQARARCPRENLAGSSMSRSRSTPCSRQSLAKWT
jgi:trans-aconitate methyltransferase